MLRRLAAPALAALCLAPLVWGAPAAAFDPASMTEAERAAFREEVRAFLMENPEVIIEAVNALEARQAEAQVEADRALVAAHADQLFSDGHSWIGGNPEGDVTVVEFMDYRCGYCRKAVPEVDALLEADSGVRLVMKEFPILGEASVLSARFAVATKQIEGDEAYKQVHDALISFGGDVSEVALRRIGEGLALDTEAILAEMNSDAVTEVLRQNRALGQAMQISGTPTFVIGDQMVRGYVSAEQMAAIVADQRD